MLETVVAAWMGGGSIPFAYHAPDAAESPAALLSFTGRARTVSNSTVRGAARTALERTMTRTVVGAWRQA
jgi:hypothetical protein